MEKINSFSQRAFEMANVGLHTRRLQKRLEHAVVRYSRAARRRTGEKHEEVDGWKKTLVPTSIRSSGKTALPILRLLGQRLSFPKTR